MFFTSEFFQLIVIHRHILNIGFLFLRPLPHATQQLFNSRPSTTNRWSLGSSDTPERPSGTLNATKPKHTQHLSSWPWSQNPTPPFWLLLMGLQTVRYPRNLRVVLTDKTLWVFFTLHLTWNISNTLSRYGRYTQISSGIKNKSWTTPSLPTCNHSVRPKTSAF